METWKVFFFFNYLLFLENGEHPAASAEKRGLVASSWPGKSQLCWRTMDEGFLDQPARPNEAGGWVGDPEVSVC